MRYKYGRNTFKVIRDREVLGVGGALSPEEVFDMTTYTRTESLPTNISVATGRLENIHGVDSWSSNLFERIINNSTKGVLCLFPVGESVGLDGPAAILKDTEAIDTIMRLEWPEQTGGIYVCLKRIGGKDFYFVEGGTMYDKYRVANILRPIIDTIIVSNCNHGNTERLNGLPNVNIYFKSTWD